MDGPQGPPPLVGPQDSTLGHRLPNGLQLDSQEPESHTKLEDTRPARLTQFWILSTVVQSQLIYIYISAFIHL